jgi:hypothetical protein
VESVGRGFSRSATVPAARGFSEEHFIGASSQAAVWFPLVNQSGFLAALSLWMVQTDFVQLCSNSY